jgi:hypothetical protein
MLDLSEIFDIESVLKGGFGAKHNKCPRPFEDLTHQAGLAGQGVDKVLGFERLWASFVDDLLPVIGPGASAVISGDWSGLTKDNLGDMLQVWKVWTRYRADLEHAASQINPFAKGGRGIDARVSRAAQAQLNGYNAFRKAISVTEEREKKGAFGRFKDWLSGKTTDLKHFIRDFDLDEWAETGWGQAATGLAAAGMVAAMSYTGDVDGYMDQRELPARERFRRWDEIAAKYPGAEKLDNPAAKAVSKLGHGTVIGHVPDGRVVYQTAVSLWVVAPGEL